MGSENNKITICRTTLAILKYSLIWPSEEDEMHGGKWYIIRVALFILITSVWVGSVLMHLVTSLINGVDLPLSEDVGFMVAFLGVYYMTIVYVKNQSKVALLLRDLSNFDRFGKPPGFEETDKKLSFFSKILFGYCLMAIVTYSVVKMREKSACLVMNSVKNLREHCGLLTPTWAPFNTDHFPVFHLVLFYMYVACTLLLKMALMLSYNSLEMVHHIILRINHLNDMIIECFEEDQPQDHKFKQCVLYHQDILKLAKRLDSCFSNVLFAHLSITATVCGCLEKQMVDVEGSFRLATMLHMFGWVLALFVACLGGQHLIDAGNSVTQTIWKSKWYRANVQIKKDLRFMLARSQKGLWLSAGSFGIISFPLFVSVIKMSYSILAVLKS